MNLILLLLYFFPCLRISRLSKWLVSYLIYRLSDKFHHESTLKQMDVPVLSRKGDNKRQILGAHGYPMHQLESENNLASLFRIPSNSRSWLC